MCTVTFVPVNKTDFILTTNRDESPNRISLAPDHYAIKNTNVLFPKDKNAGGTWIGASEKNRVLCILNGGFSFHERLKQYRMSRGIIVKELLVCDNLQEAILNLDLNDIEPFTLVIVDWNDSLKCLELVWDGEKKHFLNLGLEPKIWSSSTLYSEKMKDERKSWFDDYRSENELSSQALGDFHRSAGNENLDYGVIMDRGFVKTTSITQVIKRNNIVQMTFDDLNNKTTYSKTITTLEVINE
jgi:hypothetical protein